METIKNKPLSGSDIAKNLVAVSEGTEIVNPDVDSLRVEDTDQGLEVVRKILFGEQVRETERKQASLERHIQESVEALNKETQQQISVLKSDLQALLNAFEEEVTRQNNQSAAVTERFAAMAHDISEKSAQAQREHRELDQRLNQETERLNNKADGWRKEILAQLEQTSQQLQHDKVDRQSIADLLQGMARQISDEKCVSGRGHK